METYLSFKKVLTLTKTSVETLVEDVRATFQPGDSAAVRKRKEEQIDKYREQDIECRFLIEDKLESNVLETVKDKRNAYEYWKVLHERYGKTTAVSRIITGEQLLNLKYKPSSEKFREFCNKFDRLIRENRQAGDNIDEIGAVLQLLRCLPQGYDNIRSGIMLLDESKLTLDFVKVKIEELENTLKPVKRGGESSKQDLEGSAFHATPQAKKRKGCFNCNKGNHKIAQCWKPGGGAARGSSSSLDQSPKCQLCKRLI